MQALIADRYRVRRLLGEGGAGTVVAALDVLTGEEVALKRVALASPALAAAFRAELGALKGLAHPNLVRLLDIGVARDEGGVFGLYTAPVLEGIDLARYAGERSWPDIVEAIAGALSGLDALHRNRVLHGDVTPQNVLVGARGATLIDLSCAHSLDASAAHGFDAPLGAVRGTPGFVAPEWLRGERGDVRSDLHALGRTIEVLAERHRDPLPPRLRKLASRLVAEDPAARPVDLREVFDLLDRPPIAHGVSDASRTLGREAILGRLEEALEAFAARVPGPRVIALRGAPGSGRTRLLSELKWSAQTRARVEEAIGRGRLSGALARIAGREVRDEGDLIAMLRALRAGAAPIVLVCDDLDRAPPEEQALARALATLLEPGDPLLLATTTLDRAPRLAGAIEIEVPPLAPDAVRAWLAGRVPASRIEEMVRALRGIPGEISAALRRGPRGPSEELDAERLSVAARERLAELAVGATAEVGDPPAIELEAAGLARFEDGVFRLARAADVEAARRALGDDAIRRAHARLAERSERPVDRARHLLGAGRAREVEALVLSRALATDSASIAAEVARITDRWEVVAACATMLEDAGRADEAIRALARARRRLGRAPDEVYLLAARAQLKLSRPAIALRHLARARAPHLRADATLERARAHVLIGEHERAETLARTVLAEAGDSPSTAARAHELIGIALAYRGDPAADAHLDEAERDTSDVRARVRARSYRAIAAYRRGALDDAADGYRRALELAREHRLLDQIASAALNLATIEHRAGRFGGALELYEEARELSAALGMPRAEASVRANLAQLYLEIGAFDRARALAASARELAGRHALPFTARAAELVEAELDLREGDLDRASSRLVELRRGFERSERELGETWILEARVALRSAVDPRVSARADDALAAARRAIEVAGATDLWPRLGLALAEHHARRGAVATAIEELERAAGRAAGEADLRATIEAALARVGRASGARHAAEAHERAALALWDRCAATLPAELREAFERHPDRAEVFDRARTVIAERDRAPLPTNAERDRAPRPTNAERDRAPPTGPAPGGLLGAAEGLRAHETERLLELAGNVARARDADQILELAMDAAIELTRAERGFVLLRRDGELAVAVARNIDREDLAHSTTKYSRSIAERVVALGETVLTTDAREDARFAKERSVHAMQLRSVLCVPVRSRDGVLGALYLDNRFERGRFDDRGGRLLAGFADHVAVALTNARLRSELERRTLELERERERITALLDARTREVERLSRHVLAPEPGSFHGLVGRTPAMRRLFTAVERLAGAPVSVLIEGESGTGKELVARAVHAAGPRAGLPFVAVNCGAIPETLLEAELFGYVRGAFTGADRDREGLFVEAKAGTLFLDEVGEMPEPMQVKLLRALEEREVRPIGSNRSIPVDARIVCATNRDLAEQVRAGRFREDLYYRLAVVVIDVPPLRDRIEDVPWIARSILARIDARCELTPGAIERLIAYPWPGNVRQLENALRAATVFARGKRIDADELVLPARLDRDGAIGVAVPGGSAREEDEPTRLRRALERNDWNVSRVSRELGIPRMTLYRRLREHGLVRPGSRSHDDARP
jgi:serine/threonine-protein kinase PknK